MKVSYDKKVDAAYLQFSEEKIEESDDVFEGMIIDFTGDKRIVGIEFLDASKKFPVETLYKYEIVRWSVEDESLALKLQEIADDEEIDLEEAKRIVGRA